MKQSSKNNINRRSFVGQSTKAAAAFMFVPRFVLGGKNVHGIPYTAPSDMISLGFIGAGKQAKSLAGSFINTGEARIVALSEVYPGKAEATMDKIKATYLKNPTLGVYSDIPVYIDFRELLERKDVDAVVISTPDHWHAAMAVRSAAAGKDIYCEKPLSLTVKEGRAMVQATRKYDRVFQTGSMQRSWNEFRQAAELVRNGTIGEIKHIKVNVGPAPVAYDLPGEPMPQGLDWSKWLGPNEFANFNAELAPPITKDVFPNWRKYREFGGGGVTDWGAHMYDIVQWALDMDHSGPVEVIAPDGKENIYLTYRYANGITMTHEKWEWNNAIHFFGTEGEIKVQRGKLETSPVSLKDKIFTDADKRVYNSTNHYKDFLSAMRTRKKPVCDVEIGHRTATVCNLGNIAYRLNRSLKWNPKKETILNDAEASALLGRPMNNEWKITL